MFAEREQGGIDALAWVEPGGKVNMLYNLKATRAEGSGLPL